MRGSADIHVGGESRQAEHFMHVQYLIDRLIHVSYNVCAIRTTAVVILLAAEWWPSPAPTDPRHLS